MTLEPRKITMLPIAYPVEDADMLPLVQRNPTTGVLETRAITHIQFQSDLIEAVNDARADLVAEFEQRDTQIEQSIVVLQGHQDWINTAIGQIEAIDTGLQSAISELQTKVDHPVQWPDIQGKPTVFPAAPAAWADITGKPTSFPPSLPISWTNISDKPTSFPASVAWADVTGKPTVFTPAAHTHVIGEVTNLQTSLDAKAPLSHVTDTTNPHSVTKAQVGLGNVDNTSDANKPVSTAQLTALNGKAATVHTHVIGDVTGLQTALDGKAPISHVSDTNNPHATTKAQVGLGSVDNTSDANKPVSTATQTALNAKLDGPLVFGSPNSLTPAFGTAYQATNPAKPSFISAMIDTAYTVTVASTLADTVELRIGNNQAQVAAGTGGFVAATFRASVTGIAVVIGMGIGQRNQLTAMLPTGWYYAIRRVAGTSATISSATDQSIG